MADKRLKDIEFEDARIMFRNFSGIVDKEHNPNGDRTFAVVIPEPLVDQMIEEEYNIKYLPNADAEDTKYVKVKVNYDGKYPPTIYMVNGRKKTLMTPETIGLLDRADIVRVDLIVSPYPWTVKSTGAHGTAAYAKVMYVTIVEDKFAAKYNFDDEEEFPF